MWAGPLAARLAAASEAPRAAAGGPPPAGERGAAEGGEHCARVEALLVELCGQLELGQRRAQEVLAEARAGGPRAPPRSSGWPTSFAASLRQDAPASGEGHPAAPPGSSQPGEDGGPAGPPLAPPPDQRKPSVESATCLPTPSEGQPAPSPQPSPPHSPTRKRSPSSLMATPPPPASPAPGATRVGSLGSGSMQSMRSAAWSLWDGSNVSKEPQQTQADATGAIDLIQQDPISNYDLQGFWLDSAPTASTSANWIAMPWSVRKLACFGSDTSPVRQRARRLVSSTGYEVCVMLLIFANSAFLGWQVEYEAHTRRKLPLTTELEAFFCAVFALELSIKIYAMGCIFWTGGDAAWNYFDISVVVLMILDLIGSLTQRLSGLRILRTLRVVRFLRAVRQLRVFSQLRIMIRSIMFSLRPLLWAALVLAGMFYLFGLIFTQAVIDHLREHDLWEDSSSADLRHYFGTLHLCALSLFEAMSGGINWGELFEALSPLSLSVQLVFLFFVLFAIFGTANVVTGIFVEVASHWARNDSTAMEQMAAEKRIEVIKRLSYLFQDLDTEGDGRLTLAGMRDAMSDASRGLVDSFHALQLNVTDVRTLFLLLDRERKGHINLNEFLLGCFRLTGEATTMDMLKLQYQSEWLMHNMLTILDTLHGAQAGRAPADTPDPPDARHPRGARPAPGPEAEHEQAAGASAGPRAATEFRNVSSLVASHQWGQLVGSVGSARMDAVSRGPSSRSVRSRPSSSERPEAI